MGVVLNSNLCRGMAVVSVLLSQAGCGFYEADQIGEASKDIHVLMLGYSKADVEQCAGKPNKVSTQASGLETWKYVRPWSRYDTRGVYFEGYIFVDFDKDEVIDVRASANRERNANGFPMSEDAMAMLSYDIIKDCAT